MQYKVIQVVKFPCKNCQDRCAEPNCHTTCKKYLAAQEEQEKLGKQIRINNTYDNYISEQIEKHLRKNNWEK